MNIQSIPNENNFCGGCYQDWLEVYLTSVCNGCCQWCIDKKNVPLPYDANYEQMLTGIMRSGKKNIMLLGGEPTLYKDIDKLILGIHSLHKNIYLTTNGSHIASECFGKYVKLLSGINISIHHFNLELNKTITGIDIKKTDLINLFSNNKEINIRLNCNLIKGFIDDEDKINAYISFAKSLGCTSVRFAELKGNESLFVNINSIFKNKFGLNDDPFFHGCCSYAVLNDVNISFRQMCGLQTTCRPKPIMPIQHEKLVLYNDGSLRRGWQVKDEEPTGCCY